MLLTHFDSMGLFIIVGISERDNCKFAFLLTMLVQQGFNIEYLYIIQWMTVGELKIGLP